MARPAELRQRIPMTHNFEYDEYKEFQEIVGKDQVSKELRAMVRRFLEEQKKGEASHDPLSQMRLHPQRQQQRQHNGSGNHINTTLDIYLLSKKDIVNYISNIEDVEKLAAIEDRGSVFSKVARNRKLEILPYHKFKKEHGL